MRFLLIRNLFSLANKITFLLLWIKCIPTSLQTHQLDYMLKRQGGGRFHVVSMWNSRGVFVGLQIRTVRIFYKHSNLFDSLSKPFYKQEKSILVCQHYVLFVTKAFVLFFCLHWLF